MAYMIGIRAPEDPPEISRRGRLAGRAPDPRDRRAAQRSTGAILHDLDCADLETIPGNVLVNMESDALQNVPIGWRQERVHVVVQDDASTGVVADDGAAGRA
jgi:hypothetical protein